MSNPSDPHFKGWAKPGPIAPGALDGSLTVGIGETLDAISGYFRLFQLRKGHRFSTDDVLAAWYGTTWVPSARKVLDLGSGVGSVGMIAAWRLPGALFVTVEAQAESAALARKSVQYNGLGGRYDVREGDFRESAVIGVNETFDLILGSPPYFPPGSGVLGDHPQKIACRFEMRGSIVDYCGTAAQHLAPGGLFACVFPIRPDEQHQRVRDAAQAAGLVILRMRPVILREGDGPLLGLFLMNQATDLPEGLRKRTWVEPPLIIRCADGSIHPEYSVVKLSFGFPP
jgi:tRNA1(Val) A37 N6-methylase TrmN6